MKHLVVGAGPAGVVAAETLRRTDPGCDVTLVGEEAEAPYSRMALPYLMAENIDEAGTHLRHQADHYESQGIGIVHGRVESIDPVRCEARLVSGAAIEWDRLLIATGSRPTRPDIPGGRSARVVNCWTLADARKIAASTAPGARVVLMGAGFIGCIVLEALAARGVSLTVVEMSDRMLARMMDEAGGEMIERWCQDRGVRVMTGERVESVEDADDGSVRLTVAGGTIVEADLVVCATGVAPNLECVSGAGVAVESGILVDHHLRTTAPGIFAAGDVAQGPDFSSGAREVHAIAPTAVEHGRIAALNMAGVQTRYPGSVSMNVLNTLGLVSSSFGRWMGVPGGARATAEDGRRFRYLRLEMDDDCVVGALALGLTAHIGAIRGLIQTRIKLGPWRDRLLRDPHRLMEAYLDRTQGRIGRYVPD